MNKKVTLLITIFILTMITTGCIKKTEVIEKVTTQNNEASYETVTIEETTGTDGNEQVLPNETTTVEEESINLIGEDAAMDIVLEKIPGATAKDVRIHYDKDDGRDIYEGSVVFDKIEYDFEIDALTGDIIEWESESIYD